eukprot:scaffold35411_cov56-Phaeocystis_antarctica.AAC.2
MLIRRAQGGKIFVGFSPPLALSPCDSFLVAQLSHPSSPELTQYGLITPLRVRAEGRERAEEGRLVEGQQQVRPLGEDGSRRLFMREQVFLVHARSAPNTAISEATL